MPISLNDYANLIKDDMALGLFKNLYRLGDVIKLFPVTEVGAFTVHGQRWENLPAHAFRQLNANFNESTGTTQPTEDRLAIFGGRFTADEAYEQAKKVKLFRDPVQLQFDMHTKASERGIANNLFNGDIDVDPLAFNGLWKRFTLGEFPAIQTVNLATAGVALRVLLNAASAQAFFDGLDAAMYQAGLWGSAVSGVPKGAIFTNRMGFLGFQVAARLCGYSVFTKDLLGYTWTTYRGIPIVDVGLQRDQATEIISNTLDPGDGTATGTVMYCVRFTEPDGDVESPGSDGLTLVQAGGLRRLGPIKRLTSDEYGMEWILGIAHVGDDFCAARVVGIRMAAV